MPLNKKQVVTNCKMYGGIMMSNIIAVDKELLKTFIFDYIFNHT